MKVNENDDELSIIKQEQSIFVKHYNFSNKLVSAVLSSNQTCL